MNNKKRLNSMIKDLETDFTAEKDKLYKELENERNELGRQKSLMHVRLKNLKKLKSDIRDEFEIEYKKKQESWSRKLSKNAKLKTQFEALKEEKLSWLKTKKSLENKLTAA
jgi:predicted  nucleic acid-binding Zn-ribbon protein